MATNPGFAAFIAKKKKGGKDEPKGKGKKSEADEVRSNKLKELANKK
jgi:hypothetical protein